MYNFVYSRSLGCYHSGINYRVSPKVLLAVSDAVKKQREEMRQAQKNEALELLRPLFIEGISDGWLLYYARERGLITEGEYSRWV